MIQQLSMKRKGIHALAVSLLALTLVMTLSLPPLTVTRSLANEQCAIEIAYSSALPQISDSNAQYSLEGARYDVYSDYECTRYVASLCTDANGHAIIEDIPAGRYFIRQEAASPGFTRSIQLHQIETTQGRSKTLETTAIPFYANVRALIQEVNAETGSYAASIGCSLEGAEYLVSYYDSPESDKVIAGATRSWMLRSGSDGKIKLKPESLVDGSPLYVDEEGNPVLPLGHYTMALITAPCGYENSSSILTYDVIAPTDADLNPIIDFAPVENNLYAIRGDVAFKKVDEFGTPLAGIPFMLTHTNGDGSAFERHVVVTDEQGCYVSDSRCVPHAQCPNANDDAVLAFVDDAYQLDEGRLSAAYGTWFSEDESGKRGNADDSCGALPFGSYVLQELACSRNEGMNLTTVPFSIHQDGLTVQLGNIVNTKPVISGFAYDQTDYNRLIPPSSSAQATETVEYRNLVAGKAYELVCRAFVKETGLYILSTERSATLASICFEPSHDTGSITMDFEFDASPYAGKTIAIQCDLLSDDGSVLASTSSEDALNELTIEPMICASARDSLDGDKFVMGAEASIIERIEYEGLVPGESYSVTCVLNDKATGNAVRDAFGNIIYADQSFIPSEAKGHFEFSMPLDATSVAGHDIVVFNILLDADGNILASDQNIENASQTIKTVKLTSNAVDGDDGDKLFDAKSQAVRIVDTVNYANLVPGEQYEISGVLMDKETGRTLMSGDAPVTSNVSFVPEEVSGSVDVEYEFDASAQSSQVLVAFETMSNEGNVVAEHTDLEDVAQTVTSEDIDPDGAASIEDGTTPLSGFGSPKMGDIILRFVVPALALVAFAAGIVAIALHKRRRYLESVARSTNLIERMQER